MFLKIFAYILNPDLWAFIAHQNLAVIRNYPSLQVRQSMYQVIMQHAMKEIDILYKLAKQFNDFFFGAREPFPPSSIVYEYMKNVIYRGLYLFCMCFVLNLFFGIYIKYCTIYIFIEVTPEEINKMNMDIQLKLGLYLIVDEESMFGDMNDCIIGIGKINNHTNRNAMTSADSGKFEKHLVCGKSYEHPPNYYPAEFSIMTTNRKTGKKTQNRSINSGMITHEERFHKSLLSKLKYVLNLICFEFNLF